MIVLEYLPYGDLLGYLRKSRGHSDSYNTGEKKPSSKLTAKELLSFAWMIADGMHYLATMKVTVYKVLCLTPSNSKLKHSMQYTRHDF